uniref:Receptor ligand binding region domain-containing protein n=1 Tax=Panagrolaimus sp. JU765 TaxID=591449 RepID=A0AC34RLK9_9BILA
IRDDLQMVLNNESDLFISFQKAIQDTSLGSIKSILLDVKKKARIIVTCYEFDDEKRQHLIALNETGMNSDDIVTIFVGLRGIAFGTRFPATNLTDVDEISQTQAIWVQDPEMPQDGMNDKAKSGASNVFFLDFEVRNVSKEFVENAIEKAKNWPFFCDNCTFTSSYLRYLHDSFYMYALGLNRTMKSNNDITALSKGAEIVANMEGSFIGVTGVVNINYGGYRDSVFEFSGLDIKYDSRVFLLITNNGSGTFLRIPENMNLGSAWELQKGIKPLDVPICGFEGKTCPSNLWNDYGIYIMAVIIVLIIIVMSAAIYAHRYHKRQNQKLDQLWQISFAELKNPPKIKSTHISQNSLESKSTNNTMKSSHNPMAETKNYKYFVYRQENVA